MTGARRAALEELRAFVAAQIGFELDPDSPRVQEVIERRARAHRTTPSRYVGQATHVRDLDALVRELTVGETYFFRHREQLAALMDEMLPERLVDAAGARPVRILSAGCASGEEPYSVAIAIRETALAPTAFDIKAFDINRASIERARKGVYSPWALRETSPDRRAAWFTPVGKDSALAPEIRDAVSFETRNLLDPGLWPASTYDVVLCRNVLMYFTPDAMARAIAQIVTALRPGGYLMLGYAETLTRRALGLEVVHSHGAFYYRRTGASATVPTSTSTWVDQIALASARIARLSEGLPSVNGPSATGGEEDVVSVRVVVRAMTLVESGRCDEAEALCDTVSAVDGRDAADAQYVRSLCREAAADAAGALVHAHHAVALDPDFAFAWMRLGILARRDGDHPMARQALSRAIELMPAEDEERVATLGGGFTRETLVEICRAQLAAATTGGPSS